MVMRGGQIVSYVMKTVLKWKPHGKRPLGRPKKRWIDKDEKNLAEIGIRYVLQEKL